MQIIEQIPPHILPSVFAAIHHVRVTPCSSSKDARPDQKHKPFPGSSIRIEPLARLLQLLPRTFHTAIVASACTDADDAAALTIHNMPHCFMVPLSSRACLREFVCKLLDLFPGN